MTAGTLKIIGLSVTLLIISAWWTFVPSRPIGYLSFALNYHFHRLNVWGYHLANLAIHIANAVMVWWLIMLTMTTAVMSTRSISRHKQPLALFAALLFVSHPLATQAGNVHRAAAGFIGHAFLSAIAGFVCPWQAWRDPHEGRRVHFLYLGSLLSAVLGMLTKEIVFTLPFAIILYEFCFIRTDPGRINFKEPEHADPRHYAGPVYHYFFPSISPLRYLIRYSPILDQGL